MRLCLCQRRFGLFVSKLTQVLGEEYPRSSFSLTGYVCSIHMVTCAVTNCRHFTLVMTQERPKCFFSFIISYKV
ncbi:hypothetical protein Mapa_014645 [Marchantia paleacea]|nr:hypothetical protein Mapa_014645 [Marchantia paleacea]